MFKNCITFSLLLLCAPVAFAQIYKWVDEDGVVHYSDQPTPGSERIYLEQDAPRSRPVRSRERTTPRPRDAQPAAEPAQPFAYQSLSFSSPVPEQTLWNIGGTLNVSLSLSPALRDGDQVILFFDGEPRTIRGLGTQLEEVWRGAHNLQAQVVDANGNMMIRSQPMRFYVQQTSILN